MFDGAKECFWIYELNDITRALEISNNTAATGISVVHAAPPRGVLLRNNITEHDVAVDGEAYKFRADIIKNWQRDHSSYLRRSLFAKSPTDVTVEPAYLSSEPADRNYRRIPADGPQAAGGAGGELPSYMGALPPGPAPKDGDWFTRLRERWTDAPAEASLPRETINVLGALDLSKDLVAIANLTGDNEWTKLDNKLTYHSDGHSGKIVAPIDLAEARDYVIQVDVRRLSGDSVFTLDFPTSSRLGSGLDVFIGGQIELKLENGRRHKIGEWPNDVKDAGQLFMRVRRENATRPGSVEVTINGRRAAHWEGNVSKIGNPLESHPAFPGRMTLGLFCFKDSYEFTGWWLRVFNGHAEPLRPVAGRASAALPAGQPTSPPRSVGATLPEPPPLAEWLKGRTVLTVAKDDSGQFKTIQAALDALKPHQAVMVLDAGPYRETLHVDGLPDDVGLIGQRQATIELTAWPEMPNTGGLLLGHTLNLADGFRLSGLRFVAPPPGGRPGTARMAQLTRSSGLVIEDCCFGWTGKHDLEHFAQLLQMDNDGGTGVSPVLVGDCLFDSGSVQWDGEEWSWPGAMIVERCFFNRAGFGIGAPQVHDALFRHNVFLGAALWVHRLKKITGALEISNNTALLGGYLMFKDAPISGVTLCNNLTDRDADLGEGAILVRAEIAKKWRRHHNGYGLRSALPKSPTDVTDASGYLSSDPSARDFARIAADGALARGGAGGDWPSYIGALPPGPAPQEGDWFTRLRERCPEGSTSP